MEYQSLPDVSGWAALRAVVEKGGVTEAARLLNVGQPAITKRLRALEECYGVPLFERNGARLRLTVAGERVYQLATQTLDRQAALREELRNLRRGQNTLRVDATFTIGEHLLPDILMRFSEQHSNFRVTSHLDYNRRIETRLATMVADVALLETAPDHPDILVQKWMDDELWLLCGANHPLAGSDLLPLAQIPQLTYVMREKRAAIREVVDEALGKVGITGVTPAMEAGTTSAIVEILRRGRHVSFLPRFAVRERVEQGSLFRLKIEGFRVLRTLWIARHRSQVANPVAEALIAQLRSH